MLDPAKAYKQVPDDIIHAYTLMNVGVTGDVASPLDPLNILYNMVKPINNDNDDDDDDDVDDGHNHITHKPYVAFKLDIDTPSIEPPIVEQLVGGTLSHLSQHHDKPHPIIHYLTEFYFEHRVDLASLRQTWGSQLYAHLNDSFNIFHTLKTIWGKNT